MESFPLLARSGFEAAFDPARDQLAADRPDVVAQDGAATAVTLLSDLPQNAAQS